MRQQRMLFVRRWGGMNGGQLKVLEYARHVCDSGLFEPALYLAPGSTPLDPALDFPGLRRATSPDDGDAFFLAGHDWRVLDDAGVTVGERPVVNLIQGFAHVTPGDPRYAYLSRPALRICVSPALADAVAATGRAEGPVVTIEDAIALPVGPPRTERSETVLIAGAKNAGIANELARALDSRGIAIRLLAQTIPRLAFLEALAGSRIAVLLPHDREGFFLPPLEAMARGCAVVVPDCLGTRSFCIDGESALVTSYTVDAIAEAVLRLRDDDALVAHLVDGGLRRAAEHTLEAERSRFVSALEAYVAAGIGA